MHTVIQNISTVYENRKLILHLLTPIFQLQFTFPLVVPYILWDHVANKTIKKLSRLKVSI